MARSAIRSVLVPALLALAGCSPQSAPRPLDDLAAKPDQVRQQVEDTQREHIEALGRQEAEATGDGAESRR